jgi:penicillin amidase
MIGIVVPFLSDMLSMMKFFRNTLLVICLIGCVIALIAYGWMRQSLPVWDGRVQLNSLSSPVIVQTDALGIPQINAQSRLDAVRALGFVSANERLFQMDLMRRKSAGRLAEVFGAVALDSDITYRTYGFNQEVKQIWSQLPPLQKDYLQAYAEGVNSFVKQAKALPFEFSVLGYQPDLWQAQDTLLVVMGMFATLTSWSEQEERMMSVMAETLPNEVVAFFTPDSDRYTDSLYPQAKALRPLKPIPSKLLQALLAANTTAKTAKLLPEMDPNTIAGSNAWAVSGAKTADGRAILANDMHLALNVPNLWYRVEIKYPTVHAAGITLPGTPFLIVGSNQHIAWGMTNLSGDFLDLVKLEINPLDANQYRVGDGWRDFERRLEPIQVKGAAVRQITVKHTLWGPVSTQPLLGQAVAVHWAALDPSTINLDILELEQASRLGQALDIANLAGNPQLNILLADELGQIAWTLTGKIPKRVGNDGLVSQSWADGKIGWDGYIEAKHLPRIVNPPAGFVVSANERRFGTDFPYVIGHQFANGYRAYRISQQLKQMQLPNEQLMLGLQLDTESEFYAVYQQLALQVLSPSILAQKPKLKALKTYLLQWDGKANVDSLGLMVLVEFRNALIETVLMPYLTVCKQKDKAFRYHWSYVDMPLLALLKVKSAELLPNVGAYGSWDNLILSQLEQSLSAVQAKHLNTPLPNLAWGLENRVSQQHPFSRVMPLLSVFLDMPDAALSGCSGFCVRADHSSFGASERMVVSPGHSQDSILHMPGGQSGHPLSVNYQDQQPYWLNGQALSLFADKPIHTLQLVP